jgi:hypothetical protein
MNMRTGLSLSLAASLVAAALLLPAGHAGAVSLPGAAQVPEAAQDISSVEQARTVCRRWWNGYRWRQRCWWVAPYGYYGPRPHHRRPGYYYRW